MNILRKVLMILLIGVHDKNMIVNIELERGEGWNIE